MQDRTILSVDDNASQHYMIKVALEEIGIPVQLCRVSDGEQALWSLKNIHGYERAPRPDLILLDLNLPKKDGFAVLTEIQTSESLRSIPVVIFTSFLLAIEKKRALALGAKDYIWKPTVLDEFIQTLRSLCHRFLAAC